MFYAASSCRFIVIVVVDVAVDIIGVAAAVVVVAAAGDCDNDDFVLLFMVAVVVAVLRGPLSSSAGVAEAGLGAMKNLAYKNDDNRRLLGAAGACAGEGVASVVSCLFVVSCLTLQL